MRMDSKCRLRLHGFSCKLYGFGKNSDALAMYGTQIGILQQSLQTSECNKTKLCNVK